MKKFIALSLVFTGMLFFCACEKEMPQPDPQLEEVSALKGAESKGLTKMNLTPMPMWARMGAGAPLVIPATDEYGIITFYVDPKIIPDDFDWMQPDPRIPFFPPWFALDATFVPPDDWAIEGSSWHQPGNDFPHHYKMNGKGAVPFWIVPIELVHDLIEDGSLTMFELREFKHTFMIGYATMYNEVLRPGGGGAPIFGGTFNAHGYIVGGGKFIYHAKTKLVPGETTMTAHYKFEIIDK